MISYLILVFACFTSSQSSHLCPYPLPSHIEPCVCQVDDEYRISLTCHFQGDFASADFDRIVSAFDYNHNIFTFKIDLAGTWNDGSFSGQLNRNNVGRLNITHFIMQNLRLDVNDDLIREGAFEGSYGSIETIHIYYNIAKKSGSIDLDNVLSNAGPTLQSLKLSFVNIMRSSSFMTTPKLSEISFVDSTFDYIPTNAFSGEFLPNITSIEMIKSNSRMTIQANAFTNLDNLTSLKLTSLQSIDKIERSAFNNLPSIQRIDFSGTTIGGIEEDSFVNLSSLEAFDLTNLLSNNVTYLPRIITNSPMLTTIKIVNSRVKSISEDFFVGTPKLQSLTITSNRDLEKLVIQDLSELNSLDVFGQTNSGNSKLQSLTLKNLSSFREFNHLSGWAGYSYFSSVSFSEMENLERIDIPYNYEHLKTISINSTPNLQILDLQFNSLLNHTGLTTSLHGLLHPDININLRSTNIRDLDEFTFGPLIERLNANSESTGKIDMDGVKLDCGCDVKWLVVDIGRTDFFSNAHCADDTLLEDVDPFLLEMMCPPDY